MEPIEEPVVDVALEREPPRFTPSLGAVGGLFVVGGALGLIGQLVDGDAGRIAAGALALAVAAGALVLRARALDAPIATALVVIAAVAGGAGVLLILVDPSSVEDTTSLTAPLLFAAIGWLVLYFAGSVKGRPLLLALALVAVWLAGMTLVDPSPAVQQASPTFDDGGFEDAPAPILPSVGFDLTGPAGDVGAVSLLFGLGYLVASIAFDRTRRRDVSTPFVGVGIPATALGLAGVAADIGRVPGALLALAVAGAVCWMGAATGRRLSTWAGAAGVAIALGVLVDELDGTDNDVASSLVAIAAGVVLVALATAPLRRLEGP